MSHLNVEAMTKFDVNVPNDPFPVKGDAGATNDVFATF